MNNNRLSSLLNRLLAIATEREWFEFKKDFVNLEDIGANISAIANGAALQCETRGYLVWGIDDSSHEVVGANFKPRQTKKGNEELETWLTRLLLMAT